MTWSAVSLGILRHFQYIIAYLARFGEACPPGQAGEGGFGSVQGKTILGIFGFFGFLSFLLLWFILNFLFLLNLLTIRHIKPISLKLNCRSGNQFRSLAVRTLGTHRNIAASERTTVFECMAT